MCRTSGRALNAAGRIPTVLDVSARWLQADQTAALARGYLCGVVTVSKREVWVVELDGEPEDTFCTVKARERADEAAAYFADTQYVVRVVRYVPAKPKKRVRRG
jgi:hypothetical protein